MSKLIVEDTIEIHAPASRVWTVLTDSAFIQQYMFGCVVETNWKPGSPLLWKGAADGHLYVKGDVVAIDPPHRLEYTVLSADMKIDDIPENYLTIIYELKQNNESSTQLHVSMGDFNAVGNGKARYDETIAGGGWALMLEKIKQLAENA
jgi:uncharacterized protein YndB with AHSA1/START domain